MAGEDDDCLQASETDQSYKSYSGRHPVYDKDELKKWVNHYRRRGNSKEKDVESINEDALDSIGDAFSKTKVPSQLIAHLMLWDTDSGGTNGNDIAHKLIGYVNSLRNVMQRDPFTGEILAAHALGGASAVKKLKELADKKPEEIAQPMGGGAKQEIIYKKLRANKLVKRTNREVYEFFMNRMINGHSLFTQFLGNTNTMLNALGGAGGASGGLAAITGLLSSLGGGSAAASALRSFVQGLGGSGVSVDRNGNFAVTDSSGNRISSTGYTVGDNGGIVPLGSTIGSTSTTYTVDSGPGTVPIGTTGNVAGVINGGGDVVPIGTTGASGIAAGVGGNQFLANERAPQLAELNSNPATRETFMQLMAAEGNRNTGPAEALANRNSLTGNSVAGEMRSGFYGPMRNGGAGLRPLSEADRARGEQIIKDVFENGSNLIQGRDNQGSGRDPGVNLPGRVPVPGTSEVFNYWEGRRGGQNYSTTDSARNAKRLNEGAANSTNTPPAEVGTGANVNKNTVRDITNENNESSALADQIRNPDAKPADDPNVAQTWSDIKDLQGRNENANQNVGKEEGQSFRNDQDGGMPADADRQGTDGKPMSEDGAEKESNDVNDPGGEEGVTDEGTSAKWDAQEEVTDEAFEGS